MKRLLAALGLGGTAPRAKARAADPAVFTGLRGRALAVTAAELGLPAVDELDRPFGVVMESGMDSGASFCLVALADGSTSLYLSNGGGVIGGGAHDTVRNASRAMLAVAARMRERTQAHGPDALPAAGRTRLHLLCRDGRRSHEAADEALGRGEDALSELFFAGHAIIAALRQVQSR